MVVFEPGGKKAPNLFVASAVCLTVQTGYELFVLLCAVLQEVGAAPPIALVQTCGAISCDMAAVCNLCPDRSISLLLDGEGGIHLNNQLFEFTADIMPDCFHK